MELQKNKTGLQSTNVEPTKNNNLQIFENSQFGKVRTVIKDNEVWFVLKDILSILEINNITDVKKRLNEKGLDKIELLTNGGIQEVFIVNESNLYKCIMRSNKTEAILFEDWITSEVLPSIRKNGVYGTPNNQPLTLPNNYKEALQALIIEVEKNEQLTLESEENKPKIDFANQLLESTQGIDFATCAKSLNLGFGRNKLFEICRNNKWIDDNNQPYQDLVDLGYFVVLQSSLNHPKSGGRMLSFKTLITTKGQAWLVKKLKS